MAKPLLIALAVLLSVPCSAPGATVHTFRVPDGLYSGAGVVFEAAPGEANRLKIVSDYETVTFTDPRNPVEARGRCEQVLVHRVRCPRRRVTTALARLGDRSDRVEVVRNRGRRFWLPYREVVRGGDGDDALLGRSRADGSALHGGAGNDTLRGGGGGDRLTGGPGRDVIHGGGGNDELRDGETETEAAPDRFDGGPHEHRPEDTGGDRLSFRDRRNGVTIDLATGSTSAGDTLAGVESAVGGRGDDEILGDAQDNSLDGGSGADAVYGRGGRDWITGGAGDDRLVGEDGDDLLFGDRGADALSGGAGDDSLDGAGEWLDATRRRNKNSPDALTCDAGRDVAYSDLLDTVTAECEWASPFYYVLIGPMPGIDGDSADFTVRCIIEVRDERRECAGTIALSGPDGRVFGKTTFDLPVVIDDLDVRVEGVVAVPLDAVAREAVNAGTPVQVHVRSSDAAVGNGGFRIFLQAGG